MKTRSFWILMPIIASLTLGGCAAAAPVEKPVAKPAENKIEVFGKVKADEMVEVSFEEAVKIEQKIAREGEFLTLNQPILKLDLSRLNNQMGVLNSTYSSVKVMNSDSGILLNTAKESQRAAQRAYTLAATDYNRQKALFDAGATAKAELDAAESVFNKAEDALRTASLEVERVQAESVKKSKEQAKQLQEVQKNMSDLKDVVSNNANLTGDTLVCKFNKGVVSEMLVLPGQYLEAGSPVCRIINLDTLYILADVPEEFIKDVTPGMNVVVSPTADKEDKYTGVVESIWSTSVEKNGETMIPVRIKLDKTGELKPNFNVDVTFKTT